MPQFPAARAVLTDAIRDHGFPGAAFGVWLRGQTVTIDSVGRFTYERDSPAIQPDTVFDMASLTKVMPTTAMAMLLYERGQPSAPCLVSETWDDGRPIQAELALRATPEPAKGSRARMRFWSTIISTTTSARTPSFRFQS